MYFCDLLAAGRVRWLPDDSRASDHVCPPRHWVRDMRHVRDRVSTGGDMAEEWSRLTYQNRPCFFKQFTTHSLRQRLVRFQPSTRQEASLFDGCADSHQPRIGRRDDVDAMNEQKRRGVQRASGVCVGVLHESWRE